MRPHDADMTALHSKLDQGHCCFGSVAPALKIRHNAVGYFNDAVRVRRALVSTAANDEIISEMND